MKNPRWRSLFDCGFVMLGLAWLLCVAPRELRAADFPPELVEFEPYADNPIFSGAGPGHWDVKIRERGWIRREADGYSMWYTGYSGDKAAIKLLGYATSADGLHWTRYAGNPLLPDHWVEDMMVARQGPTYYMVAEGRSDIAQLLTSSDKIHWEPRGSLDVRRTDGSPIAAGPYGTPALWHENGVWYLFYERGDRGVWLAKSTDTKTWTNVSDEPVLGLGPEPALAMNQVVKYQGRYYAYYHAADAIPWNALDDEHRHQHRPGALGKVRSQSDRGKQRVERAAGRRRRAVPPVHDARPGSRAVLTRQTGRKVGTLRQEEDKKPQGPCKKSCVS